MTGARNAGFVVPSGHHRFEIDERRFRKTNLPFHYFRIAADAAGELGVNQRYFRTEIGEIGLIRRILDDGIESNHPRVPEIERTRRNKIQTRRPHLCDLFPPALRRGCGVMEEISPENNKQRLSIDSDVPRIGQGGLYGVYDRQFPLRCIA